MVKIYVLGWRKIFSLSFSFSILIIQTLAILSLPQRVLAQANTDQQGLKPVNQEPNETAQVNAALEPAILSEINRVRTNPQGYAQWLEEQRQHYDGIWLRLPGEKPIRTNKGRKALEEAIAFLKEQQPLPPLQISEATAHKANTELENFATANNIQFFSYGRKTPQGIVMGLVVDDLFPDRRRRQSLLSSEAEDTGVVCQPDPRYAKVCAIAYSDSPATNLASSPPESEIAAVDDTVANVPEIILPAEPDPNTGKPTPIVTDEAKEAQLATENVEVESSEKPNIATLPVPPVPQAPPQPSAEEEQVTAPGTAADLEPTEPAAENQSAPPIEAESAESEPEASSADSDNHTERSESTTAEDTPETEASEPVAEAESATETEAPTETVATKPENDRLLRKVERGSLEQGDRIIAEDGSLYDFYPLTGKAGESYTIYLESEEFDAFVALVDDKGNTIKENDDISEEDSNSRIRVTLPEDGTYNIIVNTYDEKGTGKYILTLSR